MVVETVVVVVVVVPRVDVVVVGVVVVGVVVEVVEVDVILVVVVVVNVTPAVVVVVGGADVVVVVVLVGVAGGVQRRLISILNGAEAVGLSQNLLHRRHEFSFPTTLPKYRVATTQVSAESQIFEHSNILRTGLDNSLISY